MDVEDLLRCVEWMCQYVGMRWVAPCVGSLLSTAFALSFSALCSAAAVMHCARSIEHLSTFSLVYIVQVGPRSFALDHCT